MDIIEALLEDSLLPRKVRSGSCVTYSINCVERSPLAKAAAGLPAVVGKTTRGFESLPSPPHSRKRYPSILALFIVSSQAGFSARGHKGPGSYPFSMISHIGRPRLKEAIC